MNPRSFSVAQALFVETALHWFRGDIAAERAAAAEMISLAEAQGFPVWLGAGHAHHGHSRVMAGEGTTAVTEMTDGMMLASRAGTLMGAPTMLVLLAEAYAAADDRSAAVGSVEAGLRLAAKTGQHFCDAELQRRRGDLILATDPGRAIEAEALFHSALDVARGQEAKSFELRAATSLARLWRDQGKCAEARTLLALVYEWFTEGFDTRDLQDAKALLNELA